MTSWFDRLRTRREARARGPRAGGRSRSRRVSGALLATALLLVGGGADAGDAGDVLEAVQRHYDDVRDLAGGFEQKSFVASLGREETSRGRVAVKRPGRMRWEYEAPEPRVIAVDGDTVRIYTPADRQLQVAALDTGVFSPTALDFLLGTGDLRQSFDASRIETETAELGLHLTPREPARFEHLELWLDAATHELRGSIVVDVFGNRTEVRFTALVENGGVPDDAFAIDVPDGTDVIDLR